MALFENVQQALNKKGIPVVEFEKQIGLQRGGFYKWKNHDPGVSYVKKASEFLKMPMDDLTK